MGALLASFALAETQRRRGHVELDVLTRRYSEKTRRGVNLFNMSAGALVMAVVAMQLLCHAVRISRAGEVSETLRLPFGAIMVATACGFILLAVVYVADAFHRETGALQFPADGDQPGGKNNG